MTDHPNKSIKDPSGYWSDEDLVRELNKEGSDLSKRAAAVIEWLRNEMIDPHEYMRVSNERGAVLTELLNLKQARDGNEADAGHE